MRDLSCAEDKYKVIYNRESIRLYVKQRESVVQSEGRHVRQKYMYFYAKARHVLKDIEFMRKV